MTISAEYKLGSSLEFSVKCDLISLLVDHIFPSLKSSRFSVTICKSIKIDPSSENILTDALTSISKKIFKDTLQHALTASTKKDEEGSPEIRNILNLIKLGLITVVCTAGIHFAKNKHLYSQTTTIISVFVAILGIATHVAANHQVTQQEAIKV